MSLAWSTYQTAIFDDAIFGKSSTVVIARAGSGKTSTLLESSRRIVGGPSRKITVVAFANRTKERLEQDTSLPSYVGVSTLHGMGFGMLRREFNRLQVDRDKMRNIIRDEFPDKKWMHWTLLELVRLAKQRVLDDAVGLRALLDSGEVDGAGFSSDELVDKASTLLFLSREYNEVIDFDDMIWLPVVFGLKGPQHAILYVDELQDMTRGQVALVSLIPSDRVIGFGDPAQAVYFFAGAVDDAVAELIKTKNALELRLPISYRCDRAIIREAQRFVPDIEARPGAPEGLVRNGTIKDLRMARPGDLILSRSNAPLLRWCMEFVQAGIPAYIAGGALASTLLDMLDRSQCSTLPAFKKWIGGWAQSERAKAKQEEKRAAFVNDRIASFAVLLDGAASMDGVRARIRKLLTETRGKAVILSTVHQMKGEESDRVFMLVDTFKGDDDKRCDAQEEKNLWYVAITRARHELVYIDGAK